MVELEDIPHTPEKTLEKYRIGYATTAQEETIREVAMTEYDFKDLRGFWKFMQLEELTYYDIIRMSYE